MVKPYRDAYKIKQDESNTIAWLKGMYNYIAVLTAIANTFGDSKKDYLNEPFGLHQKEETPEEIRERYYQRFKRMENLYKQAQSEELQNG